MTCASSDQEGGHRRRHQLPQVAINLNGRSYRFACGEDEAQRLEELAKYLMSKLDSLMREHGTVGDERLILMAALTVADELLDAKADIDELLEGRTEDLKSLATGTASASGRPLASGLRKAES